LTSATFFQKAAGRHRDVLQRALSQRRLDDDRQVRVREAHRPRVDDLDLYVAHRRPVGVQARRQHVAEPTVDPDQGALVVLQVENLGPVAQGAGLDDDVELVVYQPRGALRRDLDLDAAERVEEPVPPRLEQTAELAVAEVQADLVAANLDVVQNHWAPPLCRKQMNHRDTEGTEKRKRRKEHSIPFIPSEFCSLCPRCLCG
jgi:hypothetical protein